MGKEGPQESAKGREGLKKLAVRGRVNILVRGAGLWAGKRARRTFMNCATNQATKPTMNT
jgi:hypothetical protein